LPAQDRYQRLGIPCFVPPSVLRPLPPSSWLPLPRRRAPSVSSSCPGALRSAATPVTTATSSIPSARRWRQAFLWGPAFAALDSDGDGATNGQELGDPEGIWLPGDPAPAAFSFPGFATCDELPTAERSCGRCRGTATGVQRCPSICGDGILADGAGEYCDGAELGGTSCVSLGYLSGEVSCRATCTVDASACSRAEADAGADASGAADTGSEADAGEGSDDTSPVETSVTQPGGCAAGGGSAAGLGLLLVAALASRRRFRAV
jgi:hypothetical protein